jgi:two-component system response regulator HydG
VEVDIRVVAATHRDLEDMIAEGSFRQDLYYRLAVVPIDVPALRERDDDVLLLADYFLREFQVRMNKTGIRLPREAFAALGKYAWPGNVRELANVIERAVALTPSHEVAQIPDLHEPRPPKTDRAPSGPDKAGRPLRELVAEFERGVIRTTLEGTSGNRTRAARLLGLTRQGLALKMARHGLK